MRSEVSYTEYGQPSGEFGIAHGGPIIDGTLGLRASAWYRYDGGWIDRVSDSPIRRSTVHRAQRQLLEHAGAACWRPSGSREPFTVTPSIIYQDRQAQR